MVATPGDGIRQVSGAERSLAGEVRRCLALEDASLGMIGVCDADRRKRWHW